MPDPMTVSSIALRFSSILLVDVTFLSSSVWGERVKGERVEAPVFRFTLFASSTFRLFPFFYAPSTLLIWVT